MKQNQLEILKVLQATSNMQKASKIIGKNASNIHRSMKSLEKELGCNLYVYRDRKIDITPEGKMVCENGEDFLKAAADLDKWISLQKKDTETAPCQKNWSEQEISYLLTIRKYANLSHAAEELYVSEPSLSQFLAKLGAWCGWPLYTHDTHQLVLSTEGKSFYRYIDEMNLALLHIRSDLEEFYELRRGTVKFGITTNIGLSLVPLIVPAFLKRFPDIRIRIRENPSLELRHLLKTNRIDFGILYEEESDTPDNDIRYIANYEEELKLVIPKCWEDRLNLPKEHPLTAEDLQKLSRESYVLVAKKTPLRNTIEHIFSNVRRQTGSDYKPVACCSSKNIEIVKRLIRAEVGISFLPDSELRIHTENSAMLSYALAPELQARWRVALAIPRESSLSRCSRELISVLEELLKEQYE